MLVLNHVSALTAVVEVHQLLGERLQRLPPDVAREVFGRRPDASTTDHAVTAS